MLGWAEKVTYMSERPDGYVVGGQFRMDRSGEVQCVLAIPMDADRVGLDGQNGAVCRGHGLAADHLPDLRQDLTRIADQGVRLGPRRQAAVGAISAVGENLSRRPEAALFSLVDHHAAGQAKINEALIDV